MILETKAILFITEAMGTLAHCLERQRHQKNAEAAVCGIGNRSAGPAVGDEKAMRAYDRVRRDQRSRGTVSRFIVQLLRFVNC